MDLYETWNSETIKYILSNTMLLDKNKNENICKLLINRIEYKELFKYCYESADGTRVNLDKLKDLENYEEIINEIHYVFKGPVQLPQLV